MTDSRLFKPDPRNLSPGIQKTGLILILLQCAFIFTLVAQDHAVALKDVTFKSILDGSDQRCAKILPSEFNKEQEYNLIIGLHGHGSDHWQFAKDDRPECKAFRTFATDHEMIMICLDYRAKTSWMGPEAEADITQIIEELKSKFKISRIYLVGGSMGGTTALTYAAIHPNKIAGVTSMNGHANHLEYQNFQEAIAESFGGTKEEMPEEYKKRSAEYWPERLTMPISFTIGENDKSVPGTSIIRLVGILKELNRDVFLMNKPGGGHSNDFDDAMAAMKFMVNAAEN